MMPKKRILLTIMTTLAVLSSGCNCLNGSKKSTQSKPRPDLPEYSIEEQKRRARGTYAWEQDDVRVGPSSGFDFPSPTGR